MPIQRSERFVPAFDRGVCVSPTPYARDLSAPGMTQEPPKPFVSADALTRCLRRAESGELGGTLDFPPDLSPFRLLHDLQPINR